MLEIYISLSVARQQVVFEDEGESSTHFMSYFLVFTVLCIAGYIIFHNKQKVNFGVHLM